MRTRDAGAATRFGACGGGPLPNPSPASRERGYKPRERLRIAVEVTQARATLIAYYVGDLDPARATLG